MKDLVKALEGLPWIVKVLLVIFVGIYGNLLRLFKSLAAGNLIGIVLSLVLLFSGGLVILWIIDLICVLIGKDIWWFC
jgi:hypothetical protein